MYSTLVVFYSFYNLLKKINGVIMRKIKKGFESRFYDYDDDSIVVEAMCYYAGIPYEPEKVYNVDEHSWTTTQESLFKEWLFQYYRRTTSYKDSYIERQVSCFILVYGFKTIEG